MIEIVKNGEIHVIASTHTFWPNVQATQIPFSGVLKRLLPAKNEAVLKPQTEIKVNKWAPFRILTILVIFAEQFEISYYYALPISESIKSQFSNMTNNLFSWTD